MTQRKSPKEFDSRIINVILVILIALPYFYPLGLPISISRTTRAFIDQMEAVQPGDTIVISAETSVGGLATVGGQLEVTVQYFAERGDVKILFWGTHIDTLVVFNTVIAPLIEDLEYGTQYAFFGYLPFAETAIAKLADDIPGLLTVDYYGTPITDLPIMTGIKNANDIATVFTFDTWGSLSFWIGHWYTRYGSKICGGIMGQGMAVAQAQFAAGQLAGVVGDARGAAEMEQILNIPGRASITTDTLSLSHSLVFILLIAGNVQYLLTRSKEEK